MSNELRLLEEIERVGRRYRRLALLGALALAWAALALAGAAVLALSRGWGVAVAGGAVAVLLILLIVGIPLLWFARRKTRNPLWIAHRIERRFPELDTRLLAALEQTRKPAAEPMGYLQDSVILEVLAHERRAGWDHLISPRQLKLATWTHAAALLLLLGVAGMIASDWRTRPPGAGAAWWLNGIARADDAFEIQVEPEDASIERGTALLVLARFKGNLPDKVELLLEGNGIPGPATDDPAAPMPMSRSLDDPLFAARVASVARDLRYAVRYGDAQTRWYSVSVFDYPALERADAKLAFPQYTKLPEAIVEDTRSVTAVEGTRATLTFRLNKSVTRAQLVPVGASTTQPASTLPLSADANDPSIYNLSIDLRQSQRYQLKLVDADGREPKLPAELAINVTPNLPPDLKLESPGRDVDVSPLEELSTRAQVWDDFGVQRTGLTYALAGKPPTDVVLAQDVAAKQRQSIAHLLPLESLSAAPDDLLSYFYWAEDIGPDGQIRRTSGDMFFAEVRPFEQIFRQGEQPAGGEQQQQQQQGQSPSAQQAEQLAELQKQIIAATWKLIRRETSHAPTQQFIPDVKLLAESQQSAREQASALAERVEESRSQAHVRSVLKHMDTAIAELQKAAANNAPAALASAISAEQAAYQELLRLRAREHEVVRGNQRQQQQAGSQSSASARRQRELDQLDLAEQNNPYETQRTAPPQQSEDPAQREQRQVLNRLRELAQRQEDLNQQMRELQSALQQARDEQQRAELQRQLARLRDQQQQMLRDTDELRDRMDQPENQQQMADSRQQLEQTRSDVRRASEALEQGMVPEASSAGARAAEQLNNLREQVRRSASGEFNERMNEMRQQARTLDQRQAELSQRLAELDGERASATQPAPQRGLRDTGERAQAAQDLAQQKAQLQQLLDGMKQTVEQAETSQPLLSRQLYDAARDAAQNQTSEALDAAQQLLDRGFTREAREVETQARSGVTRLREGVERAAEGVLGDETDALRRARDELDALAQELDREIGASGAAPLASTTQPATRPAQLARAGESRDPENRRDGNSPATQPGAPGAPREQTARTADRTGESQPSTDAPSNPRQPGEAAQAAGDEPGAPGNPGDQRSAPGPQGERAQAGGGGLRQPSSNQPRSRADQASETGDAPGQPGSRTARNSPGDLRQFLENAGGGAGGGSTDPNTRGPLTGGNFREWSDRLRDVEEMVTEPGMRAEAARIRDRARAIRADYERHSEAPNWDLVREFVGQPLVNLRQKVQEELLRTESADALVPIDRDPVPADFQDQVRRYYERLGSTQP